MSEKRKQIFTDPILMKGHKHESRKYKERKFRVCPECGGSAYNPNNNFDCWTCNGEGVIYERGRS